MKTYKNVGEAAADPTSNMHRFLTSAKEVRTENDKVIAQWMAQGLTREQAYQRALFG